MDSSGRRSTEPGHSLGTVLVKGPRPVPKDDRGGQARENPIALTTSTIRKRAITRNFDHAWPVAGQRWPDLHPCAVAPFRPRRPKKKPIPVMNESTYARQAGCAVDWASF